MSNTNNTANDAAAADRRMKERMAARAHNQAQRLALQALRRRAAAWARREATSDAFVLDVEGDRSLASLESECGSRTQAVSRIRRALDGEAK